MRVFGFGLLSAAMASALTIAGCGGGGSAPSNDTSAQLEPGGAYVSSVDQMVDAPTPEKEARTANDLLVAEGQLDSNVPLQEAGAFAAPDAAAQAAGTFAAPGAETPAAAKPLATALSVAGETEPSFRVYVAPNGHDGWSGLSAQPNASQTDGPVKTITAAQMIVREQLSRMKTGAAVRLPVNVIIAAGDYQLSAPLIFIPEDSGTAAAPVTYTAAVGGTVTISGGMPLTTRTGPTDTIATFTTPSAIIGQSAGGGQLYVNGERAVLARQPNAGDYWFVKRKVTLPGEPVGKEGSEAFSMFSDAQAWTNGLSTADRSRAIINVMHSWTSAQTRFSDASVASDTIALKPRALWPYLHFGTSQRYYIENVVAAFDAPGEWIWDNANVRYKPKTGQRADGVAAIMPMLDRLILINGNHSENQFVEHLQFKGLNFSHTKAFIPEEGLNDTQAALNTAAAIEVDGARFFTLDNCKISKTGGYGIWLRRAVRDSKIVNSTFTDLGAGGIRMGQTTVQRSDTVQTGANAAIGNRVSETGKVFAGAVGIWLGHGYDNVIANNAIFNTTYTGISVGWTWGYSSTTSGRNLIAGNLLYSIGQAVLDDLGGIYTLGISPGTVISDNVIREVRGYPGYGVGAWGIYNDAGSSNIVVENNIVVGTDNGGYHLNYGRENRVRTNLFALGKKSEVTVTHTNPGVTNLRFDGNVLLPVYSKPFVSFATAPDVIFKENAVSNAVAGNKLDTSMCGTGCSAHSLNVLTTAVPRGISVTGASSAYAAAIAARAANAGPAEPLVTSPEPEPPVDPAPPPPPVAPPMGFDTSFASATIGSQPQGFLYFPKGDLDAMRLVADNTAPGGRCLQFNDRTGLPARYFPFVFAALNHTAGTTVTEFSVKIDANSNFFHEWRDNSVPYLTGPSLRITKEGVVVGGRIVAPAAVGDWLRVKITAPLGTDTTWTLEVGKLGGTAAVVKDLPFRTTGWKQLNWLGFVSDTDVQSTACLANVTANSSIQ